MSVFFTLLSSILPLYLVIALGYAGARVFRIDGAHIAGFVINIVAPVVFVSVIWQAEIPPGYLLLPVVYFFMLCVLAAAAWEIAGLAWKDKTRNLMSVAAVMGNTGYFGFPVALALFGPQLAGLYMLTIVADSFFLSSAGYYILARGSFSPRESLRRLLRLPPLHAALLGALLNFSGLEAPEWFSDLSARFRGAYVVLGMSMIGLALGQVKRMKIDWTFIGIAAALRFLLWPAAAFAVIWLDSGFFRLFDAQAYKILALISVVPMAANNVAYAAQLDTHPEKAAAAILATTLAALFYVPAVCALFMPS